jgi:hypothetical protein
MDIATIWNSRVRAFSTDHKDGAQILGKEFDLVILGEGSHVTADIYQRMVVRAINRRVKVRPELDNYFRKTGRAVMFTTPLGFEGCASAEWDRALSTTNNHPERLHVDQADDWLETIYLREAECIENPSYSVRAFESARKTLPRDIFEEQFRGKRVRRSGLIYKEFDPDRDVVPMPDLDLISKMRFAVSFDTGKYFSSGLFGYDERGVVWRLGEFCGIERKIDDNCDDVAELIENVLGPAFGEKSFGSLKNRVDLWPIDPRSQHKQEIMNRLGIPLSDAEMPVQGSIDQVRKLMEEERFKVVRETNYDPIHQQGFLWEVGRYVWQVIRAHTNVSQSKLEPKKSDDHSMDDLRYGVVTLISLGPPMCDRSKPNSFADNWNRRMGIVGLAATMRERLRSPYASADIRSAYRSVHGL